MRSHTLRARTGRLASASRKVLRQCDFMPKSASAMKSVKVDRSRKRSRACISSTARSASSTRQLTSRFARSMQNAQSYGQPRDR